jgi:putative transposase
MGRERIVGQNIYHVYNRGVDKRDIFLDDRDYFRFLHNLSEFNSEEDSLNFGHRITPHFKTHFKDERDESAKRWLVDVLAFVLMPNHFHLLISPRKDTSLSKFMKKISGGYTNYFNIKYQRSGALFQGRYKHVSVVDHSHLLHLPFYIHANPLKLKFPLWRERGLDKQTNEAIKFLDNYYWSSLADYEGGCHFSALLNKKFILDFLGEENASEKENCKNYKSSFEDWIREHKNISNSINELK